MILDQLRQRAGSKIVTIRDVEQLRQSLALLVLLQQDDLDKERVAATSPFLDISEEQR